MVPRMAQPQPPHSATPDAAAHTALPPVLRCNISLQDFAPGGLVNLLGIGVALLRAGQVLAVNDGLVSLTGYSHDWLMQLQSLEHIIHPADRPMLEELFVRRLRGENVPDTYVCRLLHALGHTIIVQHSARLLHDDAHGKLVLSTLVEVSPSLRVAENLQRLEHGMLNTVNHFRGFLFQAQVSATGEISVRYLSEGIYAIMGLKASELVGSARFLDFVCEPDRTVMLEQFRKVAELGNAYPTVAYRAMKPTGETVWIENNVNFRKQPDGSVLIDGVGVDITRLQVARQELKRREAYYRALVQAQPDTLITLSPEGKILDFKLGADMPPLLADNLAAGVGVGQVFAPAFASRLLVALRRQQPDDKPLMLDYDFISDGRRNFLEGRLVSIYEGHLLLTLRNATERAERLRSLTESSHQLDQAMSSSRITVWDYDLQTHGWTVDTRIFDQLGYTQAGLDVTDRDFWARLLHPDDLPDAIDAYRRLINQPGAHIEVEHRMIHGTTGKHHWFITRAHSSAKRQGKIKVVGTTIDITQTREAERVIARQRELIQKLFDRLPVLLMMIDTAGYVTLYNQELQHLLEFETDERLHIDTLGLLLRADVGFDELIKTADTSPQWLNFKLRLNQGRTVHTRWLASRLMDGAVLLLGQDVTEEHAYEEFLQISLQEKEMLVQEVYHRVKNNLQIIISLIDLQAGDITDPKLRELIHDFRQRIQAIALVHQQLYQSRERQHLQLDQYVHSLLGSVLQSFQSSSYRISFDVNVEPCLLDIDTTMRIGLIINELATNSLKYAFTHTEGGGVVYVNIQKAAEGLLAVRIGDNGGGFEYRRTSAGDAAHGLQIVELLARQLGGRLAFENNNGAHFSFQVAYQPIELGGSPPTDPFATASHEPNP